MTDRSDLVPGPQVFSPEECGWVYRGRDTSGGWVYEKPDGGFHVFPCSSHPAVEKTEIPVYLEEAATVDRGFWTNLARLRKDGGY